VQLISVGTALESELQYTRVKLDRADSLRRSKEDIENLWLKPGCRVVPLHNNKSLFDAAFNCVFLSKPDIALHQLEIKHRSFLGLDDEIPYFSINCTDADASKLCAHYSDTRFYDLRTVGATLDPDVASILAYAQGLGHWQSVTQYCARCGGRNAPVLAGHAMQCKNCQSQVFPRTDPAVIMLVEYRDSLGNSLCLLGRSPTWPDGCYSTLAGFVETGESLEAAVIREVFEESGVVVENPVYVASQPWPFPQSIMLGFVASAVSSELVLDPQELANAGWFSADDLSGFGEWADDDEGFKLPRKDSIARYLIDGWIAKQQESV